MNKKKKIMLGVDGLILLISGFIFLYISPSTVVRQRLLYIIPQILVCAVCVFTARFLLGVYKEYYHDVNGGMYTRVYIHLIIADLIAGVAYYLIQHLIPAGPIRVTFLRVACVILFNLLESIIYRLLYQSGFEYGKEAAEDTKTNTRG